MGTKIKGIILLLAVAIASVTISVSAFAKPTFTQNTSLKSTETKYILKEFKGNLAIYQMDSDTPLEVLDVKISSLPERDIERIKNGITADTLNEIISVAEDYE
ncbi:MAG: hypothetical protein J6C29_02790 [Clostridia bacterium]|nr:hypothetical protein [Clostridia bacterium]